MADQILALMNSLRGIAVIVLFFGGSIFVHELGHFLAAKWRGFRVERFSIGFGPRVFSWRSKSGTEYCVSLLPLGGYVSIPELAEMEAIEGKTRGGKTREKKISYFDKVVVFAAGAFFNLLFAALLACVLWVAGTPANKGLDSPEIGYVAEKIEIEPGIFVEGPAFAAGLRAGDKVLAVDGVPVEKFSDVQLAIPLGTRRDENGNPVANIKFQRGNEINEVSVFPRLAAHNPRSGDSMRVIGISPTEPMVIAPREGMPAALAGTRLGDRWLEIETKARGRETLYSLMQLNDILKENESEPADIFYERGNAEIAKLTIRPKVVPMFAEVAKIRFREGGNARELQLVAAPQDLDNTAHAAKRDTLRVAFRLSADSEFADSFAPGTQLDGIAINGKILAPKTVAEFAEMLPREGAHGASLFLTHPDGSGGNVRLSDVSFEVVPEKKIPLVGVSVVRESELVHKTPWTQFGEAFQLTFSSIGGLLNPKSDIGVSHLSGVFSIGETYYTLASSLRAVLVLTVLININLAILNLLPIPVLDGGHILIATLRRIHENLAPTRLMNIVQLAFVVLLFGFMGYVLFTDFLRFRGNRDLDAAAKIERFIFAPEYIALHENSPANAAVPAGTQNDVPAEENAENPAP